MGATKSVPCARHDGDPIVERDRHVDASLCVCERRDRKPAEGPGAHSTGPGAHSTGLARSTALSTIWIYNARMSNATTVKVSSRGQMSLPASARRRWGVENGGEIGVIDLDGALLLVPGGIDAAKNALRAAIADGRYERAVRAIDDLDLAN